MGDDAGPMRDRFRKPRILGGEVVVLERLLDPGELGIVLIEPSGHEGLPGLEDVDHAPAVGNLQHVEAELALQRRQRLGTCAHGNERIPCRVVEEGIDLVGAGGAGDKVTDVVQGRLQVSGRQAQQRLEQLEQALGRCGLLVQNRL
jgi:hypothetical protein